MDEPRLEARFRRIETKLDRLAEDVEEGQFRRSLRLHAALLVVGWLSVMATILFAWGAGCRHTGICI